MIDDKYTITTNVGKQFGTLTCGTMFVYYTNGLMDVVEGDYCSWPKQEPRQFVVTGGRRSGRQELMRKIEAKINESWR